MSMHDTRQEFSPRRCEHFERTYINQLAWNGHIDRCPIHGEVSRRYE